MTAHARDASLKYTKGCGVPRFEVGSDQKYPEVLKFPPPVKRTLEMTDEHMTYTHYIQSKYFRTGVNTHLHIEMKDPAPSYGLMMKWIFTFKDLGSTHILTHPSVLVQINPSTWEIMVNGSPHADIWQAEAALFGGHYADYVRLLYEFEGIAQD